MAKKRWSELPASTRRIIVVVGALDSALKIAALADLTKRPASEVKGSKRTWAVALCVVNSAGVLPLVYFFHGRRAHGTA